MVNSRARAVPFIPCCSKIFARTNTTRRFPINRCTENEGGKTCNWLFLFFQPESLQRAAVGILNCCTAARSTGPDFRAGEYTWWKFWWVIIEFFTRSFFFAHVRAGSSGLGGCTVLRQFSKRKCRPLVTLSDGWKNSFFRPTNTFPWNSRNPLISDLKSRYSGRSH